MLVLALFVLLQKMASVLIVCGVHDDATAMVFMMMMLQCMLTLFGVVGSMTEVNQHDSLLGLVGPK